MTKKKPRTIDLDLPNPAVSFMPATDEQMQKATAAVKIVEDDFPMYGEPDSGHPTASAICRDLNVNQVFIVGRERQWADSAPVCVYVNEFKGKKYAHIRTTYNDKGTWKPGRGLSVNADSAKALFAAIGKLGGSD